MMKVQVREESGRQTTTDEARASRHEAAPESRLLERARSWSDARVAFDRITDVTPQCPQCRGLLTRRLGPGMLCACCGRLWLVREMLGRETG